MDPITVIASIIALGQALDRIAVLTSNSKILLDAPSEFHSLVSETLDLRLVLHQVQHSVAACHEEAPVLHHLLSSCANTLTQIEDLVRAKLSQDGPNGRKVRRLAWLQRRGEVANLRGRLRESKTVLCLSLVGISISTQGQIHHGVSQLTQLVISSSKSTGERRDASCQTAPESSSMAPLTPSREHLEAIHHTSLALEAVPFQRISSSGTPCSGKCTCLCHRRTLIKFESTRWRRTIGSLVIGIVGNVFNPNLPAYDQSSCRKRSAPQHLIIYDPPPWLLAHTLGLVFQSGPSPSVTLYFPRIVWPGAAIAIAIREGNCTQIRQLISDGDASPLDIVGPYGFTALHLAISYGQIETADFLTSLGAHRYKTIMPDRVADITQFWTTFNLIRCSLPGSKVIEDLFHLCAIEKYLCIIDASGPGFLESSGELPRLHKAVLGVTLEDPERVMRQSRGSANEVDSLGRTALHWAACQGDREITHRLLLCGADPNIHDHDSKAPLHLAAALGHTQVVEALLSAGADLGVEDTMLNTPMHIAALNDHTSIIALLIDAGADIEQTNGLSETPMLSASLGNSLKSIDLLHSFGANIEQKCCWGCLALGRGVKLNRHGTMQKLLELGARTDAVRHDRRTILHMVAQGGDCEMIQILLDAGVSGFDVDARDGDGMTAMEHLQLRRDVDDVQEIFGRLCEQARIVE